MTPTLLSLEAISCHYAPATSVIKALSVQLHFGEIGCLLGSSGCGKTTVLRAIAGFQPLSDGRILLDGQCISGPGQHMPPEKRRIGMVFQDYALFPHLNIQDNIVFGLGDKPAREKVAICDEMLALVNLQGYQKRFPHELSGGQQQRVALARALAPAPQLLLLDEPFSSLDTELRRSLALEVRDILKARRTAAIMVTHDQEEAFAFSDQMGVVHGGLLEQWDTPFNLYHQPKTRYVADFVGQGVFLRGTQLAENRVETELGVLEGKMLHRFNPGTALDVLLRPDDVVADPASPISGRVIHKTFSGAASLYNLQLPTGAKVVTALPSHEDYAVGSKIPIRVDAHHLIVFPAEG
jgi:iron(III) transport system ATP-binding protein